MASAFALADSSEQVSPTIRQQVAQARAINAEGWRNKKPAHQLMRALCQDIDVLVRALWHLNPIPGATLMATGGYGRGSLAPHSDIDLLIVIPEQAQEADIEGPLSRFVTSLWDSGLDIGHSVRTLSDCIAQAKEDLTIATSLLEHRVLVGDPTLAEQLHALWVAEIDRDTFIQGKILELQQRHQRYQDSPYSLEPNVKESPGGLRDLQVIRWIALAAGLDGSWPGLVTHGLLTTKEARQLSLHQSVLQTFRAHLHLLAGRREDRLVFDLQNRLAETLGIAAQGGRRASEVLMQQYYRAAKLIYQVTAILLADLERVMATKAPLSPAPAEDIRIIDQDFQEYRGLLDIRRDELFEHEPSAILRAFITMQKSSSRRGMTARALRALWNARDRIDQRFRDDPGHRALFIKIFQEPRGIVHALRIMNNLGILGRMLPVFRRIVGQMQHDLFHVYTVDQHILQVIRNLRRFTMTEHAHEFPLLTELMNEVDAPWKLYIAALFHDIAKGRGGDHSELGTVEAEKFCRQFNIDEDATALICFLVEEHLTMSSVAQKQDLADPTVIERFALKVKTADRLKALYLLTVADVRGTSPKVWNTWKAKLLEDLYKKCLGVFQSRASAPAQPTGYGTGFDRSHTLKRKEAVRLLQLHGESVSTAEALWQSLDASYFMRQSAEDIAWHARHICRQPANSPSPLVFARMGPDAEGLQVVVYQKDSADLFAQITAFFDTKALPVLDAKIHTASNGFALDVFLVDHQAFADHAREMISIIEAGLLDQLKKRLDLPNPIARGRQSRQSKHFPVPPTVELQPDARGEFFILSITAADRPGLLYSIAHCLSQHHIEIHTARITTLGERAEDVFLVRGAALEREKSQVGLESALLKVLSPIQPPV